MRRAGGLILGLVAVAAMAVGGWIAFRPILNRETIYIQINRGGRDPSSDAMVSGLGFALEEVGYRSGQFRIKILDASSPTPESPSISVIMESLVLIEADALASFSAGTLDYDEVPRPIRVLPDLNEVGIAAATWALDSGIRRVLLLCDEKSIQSREIARGFEERGVPPGGRLDAMVGENEPNAKGKREALIDLVIAERPDLVFYSGEEAPYGRAFDIFAALRKKGYAGRLAMGDADPEVSFLAVPTRVVEGTLLMSPIGPPSKEFTETYELATGRHAGPHAWPGYLTMREILGVLDHASSSRGSHLLYLFSQAAKRPHHSALYVAKEGKFVFVQDLK